MPIAYVQNAERWLNMSETAAVITFWFATPLALGLAYTFWLAIKLNKQEQDNDQWQ